jgi:hypothetical protein
MDEISHVVQSASSQERKYRRFTLQYPVHLKAYSSDLMVEFEAVSRNISICGLLLEEDIFAIAVECQRPIIQVDAYPAV